MKRGVATFTLDYGKCPPWLFERMKRLAGIITSVIVEEYGPDEFLRRLSDPVWFQSFGSLLAFDWNASGLTTTTMGALRAALYGQEERLGLFIVGGKGKTSKKSPDQILGFAEKINLAPAQAKQFVYLSRLTAKVDSALVQDDFQIYHHNFMFTRDGHWAVIQQGMNTDIQRARRYHWYSDNVSDMTVEPHTAIQSEVVLPKVLDLTSRKSIPNREGVMELIKHKKDLFYEIHRLQTKDEQMTILDLSNEDFKDHPVAHLSHFDKKEIEPLLNPRLTESINNIVNDENTGSYESVLMTRKVGPKTMRALTLVAEVIYGQTPSYEDPVRYSYAFGGKDGIPYPVNRTTYDETMNIIERALKKSSLAASDKDKLLRRNEKLFAPGKSSV